MQLTASFDAELGICRVSVLRTWILCSFALEIVACAVYMLHANVTTAAAVVVQQSAH